MKPRKDRRVERTRAALIKAFNELFLTRRSGSIRVSDIVEHANVGRSTFYEHYAGAADLRMQAMARPLAVLADALTGQCGPDRLSGLLEHFRENRQRARAVFTGREGEQVTRLLAGMLEERLSGEGTEPAIPMRLAALQLAAASMAPIRGWVCAEGSCPPARLAQTLCETSALMRCGLFPKAEVASGAPDQ
ncbi:MAG: TetR/AcrR family transcriptional regulator [Alphaproteobacteria bacterium]